MKTIAIASSAALALGILLAPNASASPETDILCYTNPAYRTMHSKSNCKGDDVGNFTGGGGACGVTNPPASCKDEEEEEEVSADPPAENPPSEPANNADTDE